MLTKLSVIIQKTKNFCDPGLWTIRMLGLQQAPAANQSERGLILIQVDGLSFARFQSSLQNGSLPFLKKLQDREHYKARHHYAGVPSCTPAIQGELFYGVKQCVPAFKFRDHLSGEILTFYESHSACLVEERLRQKTPGLLEGGSSYSNIFSGGAKNNAHFCVASIGWTAFFKALNPYSLIVLWLLNLDGFLRLFFGLLIEFARSVWDCLAGALQGYGLRAEFNFILSRLFATVIIRELVTLGAKLDIARGLPLIHLNFFSYDEHAHRRGPSSRFALDTLPGVDRRIRRIWNAAHNAIARDYDLWIYSDHGQEEVIPYEAENGVRVETAIQQVFQKANLDGAALKNPAVLPEQTRGGCRKNVSFFNSKSDRSGEKAAVQADTRQPIITAQGPVGFIYPPGDLTVEQKEQLAQALVEEAHIPLVLTLVSGGRVAALTPEGKFYLPQDAKCLAGDDHLFPAQIGEDLAALCRHPDSGAFVISGWRKGKRSVSFPWEYGSHAGPGSQETDGFAFLPADIAAQAESKKIFRPVDLRQSVTSFLSGNDTCRGELDPKRAERGMLRVMSYNVHSCIGMDGKMSPERIARVIARYDPDVIALQELDAGRVRTLGTDQAGLLADLLDMQYHFHPVLRVEEEMYGNAILSRHPMKIIEAAGLPRIYTHAFFEPRGALWVEIEYLGCKIQLMNTHLSFWKPEQKIQAEALCGPDWLGHPDCQGADPVILCGDLNASPYSPVYRRIQKQLNDAQLKLDQHTPLNTWFGHCPIGRIDHVFISSGVAVLGVDVPATRLEKLASDHLPLIVDLQIVPAETRSVLAGEKVKVGVNHD